MSNVDATTFGTKLRDIRLQKNFSLRQASLQSKNGEQTAISPSYWSLVERGQRNIPKPDTLRRMARGLRVDPSMILQLAGLHDESQLPSNAIKFEKNNIAQVEIVGTIKCGPNGLAMEDYQGFEPTSLDDMAPGEEYFWLRTSGNSMIGDYIRDGDLALIQRTSGFDNGDICAIIVDGEEGTLKHITKKENSIVLTASNPIYPPRIFVGEEMDQIYVAGKLVETKHKY